jgi:glycosyltransferase involved in cell wall biosynthesis
MARPEPTAARPRVIGIDARLYAGSYTGIGVYTRGLIDGLARLDPGNRYLLFTNRDMDAPSGNFTVVRVPGAQRIIWTQVLLPLAARGLELDLFHAVANHELPLLLRTPSVLTVHDLIPLLFPATVSRRHRLLFRTFIGPAIRRSSRVITDSAFVRDSLVDRCGLEPGKVTAIPLAPDPSFGRPAPSETVRRVREKHGLRDSYVLYVGATEPRKNIPALVSAFGRAASDPALAGWQLVLAGTGGWRQEAIARSARDVGLGDSLVVTGFVPMDDLPALYQAASVFVFPSIYEGFGLPVLEAMASGTPVLVSSPSALTELVGPSGLTFDLGLPGDLADKLARLMKDAALRARLSEAGRERATLFSWERCARETLAVYRAVLKV